MSEEPSKLQAIDYDRITTNITMYHIPIQGQALAVDNRSTRKLNNLEQPYQRRGLTIGEDWKHLDLGWFDTENAGCVFIENKTGIGQSVIPEKEQQEIFDAAVIYVALCEECKGINSIPIKPGEGRAIDVTSPHLLQIKCVKGSANYTLTIMAN